MSCGNSDILALIDYFQNGTDLSNNDWDNYNYFDLWNAIENGTTPPDRTVCATFVQADIRSIVFAVLGVFTSPSDYLGENIDFYYLYLKAIGQEVVSPKFSNFCIGQLYDLFSIGLTAKFRQGQNFECTMSKVTAIASITFEQGQKLDALLSKSAAIQNAVFEQQQTFNAELASAFTGLLDDYPNAAAAYSIRLLSSTYSGPLVRIRKETGGNPEKDFYADENNELSLNSSDGGGTTLGNWIGSNNGYIVTWYDQSGSNDATQTTASAQPKIINAGSLITENGKVAIDFNASFRLEVVDFVSALDELTIITVNAPNATNVFSSIYSGFDSFANYNLLYRYSDDGKVFAGFSGVSASSNYSSSSFYVAQQNLLFLNFDNSLTAGSQAILFVNSVDFNFTGINDTGTLKTVSNGYIGSRDSALIFSGTFQEFIIYNTEQSTNRTGIETNINDFYTIY